MTISRRDLAGLLAAAGTMPFVPLHPARADDGGQKPEHVHDMSMFPKHWYGSEKIAFLLYPRFTALDLVGPHYMLASLMGATCHIVSKTLDPVESDLKLAIKPSSTFEQCPADLDVLFVPGGTGGTIDAMEDPSTIAFLKDRGARAKYVTSVCTGSLLLGAAGLLAGYKATGHWAARDVLRDFGAEPLDQRVVVDRNRITGAGVTAGLDMGLLMIEMFRDRAYAEGVQLLAEYAPEPPFTAGTPATAPKASVEMMTAMLTGFAGRAREIAKRQRTP